MAVYLAYDGSINGDWIARYAIRLAAHTPERWLGVLYAEDVSVATPELAESFEALAADAEAAGVDASCEVVPARGGVFRGLLERVPEGPDTVLVCGLRVRGGRRGYLSGTISEQLLASSRFQTVAIRVVQPGLLGMAREVLVPVKADPRGFHDGLPVLKLLAPDIARIHLLHVMTLGTGAYRRLSSSDAGRLRAEGLEYAHRIEAEIAEATPLRLDEVDPLVRVSDDWVKEIVIQAGRLRTGLIYMEAPRASLNRLFSFGDPVEELLRDTPCDVALFRGTT
jgi:nucleotide-binding universal stress UspA family protein